MSEGYPCPPAEVAQPHLTLDFSARQLEAFEEMVKRGDLRRANEEKEIVYKYIVRLINILMLLKVRLK